MNNTTVSTHSVFISGLTILFIGLKLTDNIDWSWVWVLSPLWIPLVFILVVLMFVAVVMLTAAFIKMIDR
jgi:hypothetical protein